MCPLRWKTIGAPRGRANSHAAAGWGFLYYWFLLTSKVNLYGVVIVSHITKHHQIYDIRRNIVAEIND